MRKIFTFILALTVCTVSAFAGSVKVGGVNYNLNTDNRTAEVASGWYTGNIVVPANVEYEGVTYKVTAVGQEAFYYNDGLLSVTLPNTVTTIGDDAFSYNRDLENVTLGNAVVTIGASAFMGTGLTEIVLPKTVQSIGSFAFSSSTKLVKITCKMTNLPTLGEDILLDDILSKITLYVPLSAYELYKTADQWKDVGSIETFDDTAIPQVGMNGEGQKAHGESRKVIRDGVMYIERNGELFNLTGVRVE